ncbi:MAG: hypothetical protein KBD19_00790 [Candidatus Moranbacteria bacterium]|nr:hypothetical protein [Candidatus Moranbacteria bacterium]
MQDIDSVTVEEEGNKRRRQSKKSYSSGRLRQALFLSGAALFVFGSAFAFARESEGVDESNRGSDSSEESLKELCLFRLEQELWESFGGNRNPSGARTDAIRNCEEIVSGKDIFVSNDRSELEAEIRALVSGYPIEAMATFIASYDREIAALLIGIAKKESDWGKRVPLDDVGKDCFNYWGYKGAGSRGIGMGHGCFGSPEEAVSTVGNRLAELVAIRNTSDPANMIIWKCGSSCAGHSPESVRKWIADVDLYYRKLARS